jgi:exonuclease V gamma subunit
MKATATATARSGGGTEGGTERGEARRGATSRDGDEPRPELWVAASWEALLDRLAEALRTEASAQGLFGQQTVVLPGSSPELRRWVREGLTTRLGVLAQVRFVSESAFLEELAAASILSAPRPSTLARLVAMVELLDDIARGERRTEPVFAPVRAYLANDPRHETATANTIDANVPTPLSAHGLAFADEVVRALTLLERQRIDPWGATPLGAPALVGGEAPAPAWLWALGQEAHRRLGTSPLAARLASVTAGASAHTGPARARGVGRTHWFGLANVDTLVSSALGPARELGLVLYVWAPHLLVPPSKSLDPALPTWATRSQRVLHALAERGLVGQWLASSHAPSAGARETTLAQLQAHFRREFSLAPQVRGAPDRARPSLSPTDDSLSFHGCHGPLRQVEVLHDALLALLERHPTLSPRDIRILTPSIETYAPLLEAVFAAGDARHGRRLPLALPPTAAHASADRDRAVPAGVVDRVLALVGGRFEAAAVLGLLDEPAVRSHFRLSADDLAALQGWLTEAMVRWGLDGADRARFVRLPGEQAPPADPLRERDETTWAFGLDRLALSITSPADTAPFCGRTPAGDWEGSEARLGATLLRFVVTLRHHVQIWTTSTNLGGWTDRASALLAALVGTAGETTARRPGAKLDDDSERLEAERAHAAEREAVDSLRRAFQRAGVPPEARTDGSSRGAATLEASGFRLLWREAMPAPDGARRRAPLAGIAVAPLTRSAALPARVVALLGLDEDTFPAAEAPLSLATPSWGEPRPLDPCRREEDRAALLQALLSASAHVVVTAGLRHPQTHAPRPPATPLAEWFEVIDECFDAPGTTPNHAAPAHHALVRHHPLQAFDERAFGSHAPPRAPTSHDPTALSLAVALGTSGSRPPRLGWFDAPFAPRSRRLPDSPETAFGLADFVGFFRDPLAALLRIRLGVRSDRHDEHGAVEPRREPLSLDGLTRWQLREHYFRRCLALLPRLRAARGETARGEIEEALLATGRLPVGGPAAAELRTYGALFDVLDAAAGPLLDTVAQTAPRRVEVEVEVRLPLAGRSAEASGGAREITLTGSLTGVTAEGLLFVGLDDPDKPNRLLQAFTSLLVLLEADPALPPVARLVGVDKDGHAKAVTLTASTDPEVRRAMLRGYVDAFYAGLSAPLPFAPRTSLAFVEAAQKELDGCGANAFFALPLAAQEAARRAADRAWFPQPGGFGGRPSESESAEARAVYGEVSLAEPSPEERREGVVVGRAFVALAEAVWRPILVGKRTERFVPSEHGQGSWQTR